MAASRPATYARCAGTCPVYGWTVWSHTYAPRGPVPVPHTAVAGPPEPEPDPRADCPRAAPGASPTVTTGDAGAAPDGTATLSGTVHPEGTPTTYRFEYGADGAYGATSEERAVSVAPRTNAVSVPLAGLQPGGAAYHYRIVAVGEHGTRRGRGQGLHGARPTAAGAPSPAPPSPSRSAVSPSPRPR